MSGIVAWFARNGVAANLLMVLIVVLGLATTLSIKKEVFPELASDLLSVSVVYPGAAPEEVEEGIVVRVEERLEGLDGIKKLRSTANENVGTVIVEIVEGFDTARLLNDVKSRVDAIDTFPAEAEKPVIEEVIVQLQVLEIALFGDAEERTLKILGDRVRDDLAALPEISQVELRSARPYEIAIEISEEALRRYGLTFDEVADAVRRSSLDLPGGRIDSTAGEILLRGEGQAYRGPEFERIPVVTSADGTRLTVGDVATVVDGFADTDLWSRFDGKPAVLLQVFRTGDQSAIDVVGAARRYLEEVTAQLPAGIELAVYRDETSILRARLDLLVRNGVAGFILVFFVLALFLRLSLAGWVALGIPISFLGGIALMPGLDVSINMISLFAFIIVLGIVVDDAIVVGENIYSHFQRGKGPLQAAIDGSTEVLKPVVFAVLTTIAAFAPLLNVTGTIGKFMRVIPLIVIATLVFSLIESLLILPHHLSHARRKENPEHPPFWRRVQKSVSDGLQEFIAKRYVPLLEWALDWRYLVVAANIALLLLTGAIVGGGWIEFNFLPAIEADNVAVDLTMPLGTPAEVTDGIIRRLETAALELEREIERDNGEVFEHVLASVGSQPYRHGRIAAFRQRHGRFLRPPPRRGQHRAHRRGGALDHERRDRRSLARAGRARPRRRRAGVHLLALLHRRSDLRRALRPRRRAAEGGGRPAQGGAENLPGGARDHRFVPRREARARAAGDARGRGGRSDAKRRRAPGAPGLLRRGGATDAARPRRGEGHGPLPGRRAALAGRSREPPPAGAWRGGDAVPRRRDDRDVARPGHDPAHGPAAHRQRHRRPRPGAGQRQRHRRRPGALGDAAACWPTIPASAIPSRASRRSSGRR